jgi:phosphatidylglycerol---prolipoprotein diacylglyceryl transferase
LAFSLSWPELSGRRFFTSSTTGATTPNNWREIFSLNTLQAGGVFSGGLIGALLMAAWYMRRHRMPWLRTTDAFAPGTRLWPRARALRLLLGWLLLRQTDQSFLGRHFHQSLGELVSGTPLGVRIEPTQLIEAAAEFFNFLLLMWLLKRKKFDGQVFSSFIILYGVERYFIEFLRGDPGRGEVFGGLMTGTQLISILLVIGGGLIWWLKSSRQPAAFSPRNPAPGLRL